MSTNNNAVICGNLDTNIVYDHESYGKNIYRGLVSVVRTSGNIDTLNVLFPENCLSTWAEKDKYVSDSQTPTKLYDYCPIYFKGEIRTHNKIDDNGKNRLHVYVYATEILQEEPSDAVNDVSLIGFICAKPRLRNTPKGKIVVDFMLAVQRDNAIRSDYIPCIAWSKNAHDVSGYEIGTKVCVHGRFQSRTYIKNNAKHTAYEMSVSGVQTL